jgi:hypothetical protein
VRRREALGWSGVLAAGELAIGGFGRSRWRFAADAEGYEYIVWVFNGRFTIPSPEPCQLPSFVEKESLGTAACCYSAERKSCSHEIAGHRARDSVRRASGFVQIAITLSTLLHW